MEIQLGPQGHKLQRDLRQLFGGNHVREENVVATSEVSDRYTMNAFVVWRFEHQISTSTSKGNASIAGRHFGYASADYQRRLQELAHAAVNDRNIRGPFMQRIDTAGPRSLEHSATVQPVHDYGSYSVFRQCGSCVGTGKVTCGGCSGRGRRTCGGCGGAGSHTHVETHTRWNGRQNQTYSQTVRRTCGSCGGGGRVVCTNCGGSGKQTCSPCGGHGFFTDISRVQAIARPWWQVPKHRGLAADALVGALERRGPTTACELVPFGIDQTEFNDTDDWVVRYIGVAEVVELGLDVAKTAYTVAAAGALAIPLNTPAVFDQLLANELADIAALNGASGKSSKVRRHAKRLFAKFRELPVLDRGLKAVAKLGKDGRSNPGAAVANAAHGFISAEAATSIGTAMLGTLDKVSPAYSRLAWAIVAVLPVVASFAATADAFTQFSVAQPQRAILPFVIDLVGALLAMLAVSPIAWLFSASVSSLMRMKVPPEYRQRGRNWVPLKVACTFSVAASALGAVYGGASGQGWVPTVRTAAAPAMAYVLTHAEPGSEVNRLIERVASPVPAPTSEAESNIEIVRYIQRYLIAHGYMRGIPDGNMGPRTSAAIERYERKQHLAVNTPLQVLRARMQGD